MQVRWKDGMGIMKQRVAAAFAAVAFMTLACGSAGDAQRKTDSLDDWLGFDQSDDVWKQPAPRSRLRQGVGNAT